MLAAIDLDQDPMVRAGRARMRRDRLGGVGIVGHDGEIDTGATERRRTIELRRYDADGIKDVAKAFAGEIFGLGQGRDRDAARLPRGREARNGGALRGLHVRTQRHAVTPHGARHDLEIAREFPAIEEQAGRREVRQVSRTRGRLRASHHVKNTPLPAVWASNSR